jgi:hypothetical protein
MNTCGPSRDEETAICASLRRSLRFRRTELADLVLTAIKSVQGSALKADIQIEEIKRRLGLERHFRKSRISSLNAEWEMNAENGNVTGKSRLFGNEPKVLDHVNWTGHPPIKPVSMVVRQSPSPQAGLSPCSRAFLARMGLPE